MFYPYPHLNKKNPMIQVSIDRQRVIHACKNYLAKREARIQRDIDDAVKTIITPHKGIFGPIKERIWPTPKTREEALAILKKPSRDIFGFSWMDEIKNEGLMWGNRAKRMLRLCEASTSDYVVLDEEGKWILDHE
jgi:hypothetical protein